MVEKGDRSQPQYLVRLLCTLQSSLIFWCRQRLEDEEEEEEEERVKEREVIIELLKECEFVAEMQWIVVIITVFFTLF